MLKRIAVLVVLVLTIGLTSCSAGLTGGLKGYIDTADGYQFLYPLGWVPVKVTNGPDVVLRDLINETENVSVIINPVTNNQTLSDLGSPEEVGYQLQKNAIAPTGSGRIAELVDAQAREAGDKTYYILEYEVKIGDQKRHDVASVIVNRGKLYTLNASTTDERWGKVKDTFFQVARSFSVS